MEMKIKFKIYDMNFEFYSNEDSNEDLSGFITSDLSDGWVYHRAGENSDGGFRNLLYHLIKEYNINYNKWYSFTELYSNVATEYNSQFLQKRRDYKINKILDAK